MRSVLFLLAAVSTTAVLAADWPQFRGPNADGISAETSLSEEWPAAGPPVVWSRAIGVGYSGFAIADGRVYTQGQSLYQQYVECLDAATGRTLWSHAYGLPFDGGAYPGPRATPTVGDGRVYFAAPNGLIGCLDASTGASIWATNPKVTFGGKGTDFGASASPVLVAGRLIVPVGGPAASLVALDAQDGAVVWKCGERPASYATPLPIAFEGRTLIVAPLENSILLAEAKTGRKLFELQLSQGYDEHSAAPVYCEPFLFLSAPFRAGGDCYRIVAAADDCRLERVWDTRQMSNDIASCVLAGDTLFGFDLKEPQARLNRPSRGEFRALDWLTGETRWSSADAGHANVIAADGKLILFNDRGELILLRQSAEKFDELARSAVFQDEICWTAAAFADGCVFVRTPTRAACLDLRPNRETKTPSQTVADIPQPRRFRPQSLLGGEREFPATPPDGAELRLWFGWNCLGLLLAGVFAAVFTAVFTLGRRSFAQDALFFAFAFISGAVGAMLVNRIQTDYVFTLPLALWALGQATVDIAVWAQRTKTRSSGWYARGAMLLFIAGCGAYFHFCRRLGLSIEWSFLVGVLPWFPFAVATAYAKSSPHAAWLKPLARIVSFTAYFWSSAAYIVLRLTPGG